VRSLRSLLGDQQAHTYRGPLVLGIRDVSRDLQFKSSYTIVEHAPEKSIKLEIERHALERIEGCRPPREKETSRNCSGCLGLRKRSARSRGTEAQRPSTPASRTPWPRP